jgi:hypothetical protein
MIDHRQMHRPSVTGPAPDEPRSGPRTMIRKGEAWPTKAAEAARVVDSPRAAPAPKHLSYWVVVFVVSIFLPWLFTVGSMALSPYRLVLIVATFPCLAYWLMGRAGRVRLTDILLFMYWAWCSFSFIVLHGLNAAVQPAGILFFETLGPYLLARCFIRDAEDFRKFISLIFTMVAILLPFSIAETLTGRSFISEILGALFRTHISAGTEPRWGLSRVQSVFEHPILYGVVMGSILAFVHLVLGYGQSAVRRNAQTATVAFASFLSLSAGPISSVVAQIFLLMWNWLAGSYSYRWRILWGLGAAMYVTIAMVSNQTVPEFYLTHFSFDALSANYRVLIWTFGSESVLNHPLWGVGLGEWDRPDWMPPSIDMFWLIHAVQHGIPAGLFMLLAFFSAYLSVSFTKFSDERLLNCRTAYSIVMTGFFMVGWTVHFWNATYVLFLFLLGSGIWLRDAGPMTKTHRSSTLLRHKQR